MPEQKLVLIIDDDHGISDAAKAFLLSKGFEVVQAFDGEEGVETAKGINPDLILLDIIMPKKDGFTVVRELKANPSLSRIPVIVYSAKEGMKELFAIEGIEHYLVKPINNNDLLACVNKLLGMNLN